jgi:hypothetical protein
MLLSEIKSIDDWVKEIIKDDPVRPDLSAEFRINKNAEMFGIWEKTELGAVCCVRYTKGIPDGVVGMAETTSSEADTAVFYTIWSYRKGSGRELINQASESIKNKNPNIKNIVTLSPKTEMAERFHLRNGAWRHRENADTINYAYELNK